MARRRKKRKNNKKKSFSQKFFSWILSWAAIILVVSLLILNVLDLVHLGVVIAVIFVLCSIILLLIKKKKKLGYILSVLFSIIFILLIININKTVAFFSGLDLNYKTYQYSVVVLKSSDYKKLKDISNKKLGYYDNGSNENEKALNKVRKKQELEVVPYEDTHKLANDLLSGSVDAILIESSYLNILDESIEKDGNSFKSLVRVIYEFSVLVKTDDISHDINVTKESFSVYVSGIDTYGEISNVSRSDVNMIVTVNPKTRQILLTSIPRDYYVQLHGKSGYPDKLTHAGLYGVDMSMKTLEDLLDIEINYYVKVNFSSVVNIVNALDGVDVYSEYDFTSIDNYHYQKGYNFVRGDEALSFARERKSFAGGDRQRIKNQQALLAAIFNKVTSRQIIVRYGNLLDSLNGSFVTNMKMSRLTSLIRLQLAKNYSWNLVSNSLKGDDGSNYTYSAPSFRAYVMVPNDESVQYAHDLIEKVLKGEEVDAESIKTNFGPNRKSSSVVSKVVEEKKEEKPVVEKKEEKKEEVKLPGLEVSLKSTSVSFDVGDSFEYTGYNIKYHGEKVDDDSEISEMFKISGKSFSSSLELVNYVNGLSAGEYTIQYTIKYKGESVSLNQKVVINEKISDDKEEINDDLTNQDDDSSLKKEDEE